MKQENKVYDIVEVAETFGRYQKWQFFYCCVATMCITMININYVFTAGDVNYRCRIPECETSDRAPLQSDWWPDGVDRCSRPVLRDPNGTAPSAGCTAASFTGTLEQCSSWVYESNDTIIAELDLACQPWKSNLVGTVHSAGMVLSMALSGWMCDKFGRKPTLVICSMGGILGHLKTFVASYYLYIVIEFFEAAIAGGTYSTATIIMIESSGKDNRVLAGVISSFAVYLGEAMFACIAMVATYWKTLVRIICSPPILFISYTVLIRENLRWQILNNKFEQAKETLLIIAETNKLYIDKHELSTIDGTTMKSKFNLGSHEKESIKKVFGCKEILKRLGVVAYIRFTASFVYYGLMINSVWLPGDKYINFLLSTVMSFPGELVALVLINNYGRRMPLLYGYLTCGLLCIASGYVPGGYTWTMITLFLISKMIISACFTGIITYTMELFPTSARGTLMGLCSFTSRVGGMLAPLTPILTPISAALPSILFGVTSILSGISLIVTPETRNLPLMDTVDQVEASVRAKEVKNPGIDIVGLEEIKNPGIDNAGFEEAKSPEIDNAEFGEAIDLRIDNAGFKETKSPGIDKARSEETAVSAL